jgi:hypothetical protein
MSADFVGRDAERLLSRSVSTSGSLHTHSIVKCAFGPFERQQQMELGTFTSFAMGRFLPLKMVPNYL